MYGRLAGALIYPQAARRAAADILIRNQRGQRSLWSFGHLRGLASSCSSMQHAIRTRGPHPSGHPGARLLAAQGLDRGPCHPQLRTNPSIASRCTTRSAISSLREQFHPAHRQARRHLPPAHRPDHRRGPGPAGNCRARVVLRDEQWSAGHDQLDRRPRPDFLPPALRARPQYFENDSAPLPERDLMFFNGLGRVSPAMAVNTSSHLILGDTDARALV